MKPIPKNIDCRVDHTKILGYDYSLLVESTTSEILFIETGIKKVNEMYKELKWQIKIGTQIDNYPWSGLKKYYQIKGASYMFPFR